MYAYGTFGVVTDGESKTFDSLSDLNYHPDKHEMVKALCLHADDRHNDTSMASPHAENYAALWNAHKATMRANVDRPYQQIAAPDGRIYWWMRLV
jgi:hypothetical protein